MSATKEFFPFRSSLTTL